MIKLTDILLEILNEDRCQRIADRRYSKPSAYKSGAIVRCRKGKIWKKLKESNNNLNNIKNIFELYPELSNIGSYTDYSEYLNTVFPNSMIKDIVYHGAIESLLPKDNKFKGYITYFTTAKKYAETFGIPVNRKVIAAIIDIQRPFRATSELADVPYEIHITDQYTNPRIIKSNNSNYDSVIGKDAGQREGNTIAVFNPEQIYILGSKQDIEGFKKFMRVLNEKKETLRTWFKRKGAPGKTGGWVDCNTCREVDGKKKCKPCGRQKGEKRAKYPSCRPTPSQCGDPGKGKKWGKTK